MTMVALASAKASPGVTTTALALGAVWPTGDRQVVVAECDPAGGDLAGWYDLPTSPGLVSLAPAVRRATRATLALSHTQTLPGGLRALVAPVAAEQASGALRLLPPRLLGELDDDAHTLWLADCGRITPDSPALSVAAHASVLLLVTRPVTAELGHTAALVAGIRPHCHALGLVLVGTGPYQPREVGTALGIPVLGVVPTDPRGAAALTGTAAARPPRLARLGLLRAARQLAARLGHDLPPVAEPWPPPPPAPPLLPALPAPPPRPVLAARFHHRSQA